MEPNLHISHVRAPDESGKLREVEVRPWKRPCPESPSTQPAQDVAAGVPEVPFSCQAMGRYSACSSTQELVEIAIVADYWGDSQKATIFAVAAVQRCVSH